MMRLRCFSKTPSSQVSDRDFPHLLLDSAVRKQAEAEIKRLRDLDTVSEKLSSGLKIV